MSRFLIVTHGTTGDIGQLIRLGRCLRERGHDVVLLSHGPYRRPADDAGLAFVALDSEQRYARHLRDTPDLLAIQRPIQLREFFERNSMFDQMRYELDTLLELHRPHETVMLGRHGSAFSVLHAGEATGSPAVWTALYPSQLLTVQWTQPLVEYGLGDGINEVRAEFGLPPVTDWQAWYHRDHATLALWPEWFDRAGTPAPPDVAVAGFIAGDDDDIDLAPDVAALLSGDTPAVLVTGGTGRMLHSQFYPTALGTVLAADCVRLVVTPHRDLIPDPLPAGVHWFPRLPFAAVMPRVAAVVHHGGVGTLMRALRAGARQLVLAHGLDRPDNAQRLASLGLAWWANPRGWDVRSTSAALRDMLAEWGDTGYRERATACIGGEDTAGSAARAASWLEALLPGKRAPRPAPAQVRRLTTEHRKRVAIELGVPDKPNPGVPTGGPR